jgi:magnesium-transporting ATPase (P-type)
MTTAERDGTEQSVPLESLVVGDLVRIHEGDVVPAADAAVALTQLLVDEAALTGESLPLASSPVPPATAHGVTRACRGRGDPGLVGMITEGMRLRSGLSSAAIGPFGPARATGFVTR